MIRTEVLGRHLAAAMLYGELLGEPYDNWKYEELRVKIMTDENASTCRTLSELGHTLAIQHADLWSRNYPYPDDYTKQRMRWSAVDNGAMCLVCLIDSVPHLVRPFLARTTSPIRVWLDLVNRVYERLDDYRYPAP